MWSRLRIAGTQRLASAEEVQELLLDLPNEITFRSNRPQELAELLVQGGVAESLKIGPESVTVATRDRGRLVAQLPEWLSRNGIEITEMRSADESLQGLFNTLMKLHRGEV